MKSVSLSRYIIILLLGTVIISVSIIMICFISMLYTVVNTTIGSNLRKTLSQNSQALSLVNGKLFVADTFRFQVEDYYYLVLDQNGEILAGEYPPGFSENPPMQLKEIKKVTIFGESYRVMDFQKKRTLGDDIFVRGVVKESDVYKEYRAVGSIFCTAIVVVFGIVMLLGMLLSKRIVSALQYMCEKAKTIGNLQDISQRVTYEGPFREMKILADANNRMLDGIEEMMQSRNQFSADAAHELRTPIAVIEAECQYAREKIDTLEEAQEAFQVIERQSTKMKKLINQLMKLYKLEQDQQKVEKEQMNLAEVVEFICEEEQLEANATVQIILNLTKVELNLDVNLFTIALHNLISNALKFSSPNSKIEVSTGIWEEMAFVSVRDYGIGIEEQNLQNIFRRFYREDQSRNSQGYGLGLSIAQKIAEIHGGTIEVSSKIGQGSTFTMLLAMESGRRSFKINGILM